MSKKSVIQRELKRKHCCASLGAKRDLLRAEKNKKSLSLIERLRLQEKLDEMPRDSSYVRKRNRCFLTGRPRGYYRRFGVSRIMLRQFAGFGLVPGVLKSSW